jgi:hypothetical protein
MKITFIVEGDTEKAFVPHLRNYLQKQLAGRMPRIDTFPYNGRIPKGEELKRVVEKSLRGKDAADYVIALTDVYTGTNPPEFTNASDAKKKMHDWVGNNPKFFPHAAQFEFEAWLLPYWKTIQRLAKHNKAAPAGNPEQVNHNDPPAHRIREVFEVGKCRDSYIKPRDAGRILRENDLSVSVVQCNELKALVNSFLSICGGTPIL